MLLGQQWVCIYKYTRQMIIIAGGEPELCHRRHAKREGGVYAPPYALRVRKSCASNTSEWHNFAAGANVSMVQLS